MSKPLKKQIKLGAFLMQTGHHIAGWRHPDAAAEASFSFQHYADLAKRAEAAKFDAVFLADSVGVRQPDNSALFRSARAAHFEPLTLLSALAAVTHKIGVIGTASTSFNEPYTLARQFASLDQLSNGRAGWNLVTSSSGEEARNFGLETHYAHQTRYQRAQEFHDVVTNLWDSWDDDAYVGDKAQGIYTKPHSLRPLNHRGEFFSVAGPLNVTRSAQGHPVVVQAGASEAGRSLAAATAEVIFVAHQTLEEGQQFYKDIKNRVAAFGRNPDHTLIMPGAFPVIGESRAHAQEKFEQLQELIHPEVGLALVSSLLGIDLQGVDVDSPLPAIPETEGAKSRRQLLLDLAGREQLSIRDLYLKIAGARGHWQLVGTANDIADQLQLWFESGAADGFNIMAPWLPGGLIEFIDHVLPELRRRGLFRSEYSGSTLREHLGLPIPAAHASRKLQGAVA